MRLALTFRRRFTAISLAGIVLLGLCTYAGVSAGADAPKGPSMGMLIHLHDLQYGYRIDEEVGCGGFGTEGAEPPLAEFVIAHRPRGCQAEYDRLYPVPGPKPDPGTVSSLVIDARSAEGAVAAERIAPELLAFLTGNIEPKEVPAKARIGAQTRLFHTGDANVLGHGKLGSIYFWRQGNLLGAILAGGDAKAANDRVAARLARLQRSHMRKPVRDTEAQSDDLLVPLDNPAVKLPVYWLGREFDPGNGDAPIPLTSAYAPLREEEAPPGTRIELEYGEGLIRIGTGTEASWDRYQQTKLGRELLTWKCTRAATLPVPIGEATIYRGYAKDFTDCPQRPPDVFSAVIHSGQVVLGLNLPLCYTCLESPVSAETLKATAGSLRLRPQRDLARG
jgi:hypothetical protein